MDIHGTSAAVTAQAVDPAAGPCSAEPLYHKQLVSGMSGVHGEDSLLRLQDGSSSNSSFLDAISFEAPTPVSATNFLLVDAAADECMPSNGAVEGPGNATAGAGAKHMNCASRPSSCDTATAAPGSRSGSGRSRLSDGRHLYRLALVDDTTGSLVRPVTDDDVQQLTHLIAVDDSITSSAAGSSGADAIMAPGVQAAAPADAPEGVPQQQQQLEQQELEQEQEQEQEQGLQQQHAEQVAEARPFNSKGSIGGPCDHCGAKDSPQWRRGPAAKPILCNACGTRYRRTNNLGPPIPSSGKPMNRKRPAAGPAKPATGRKQPQWPAA